ncbi:sulfatase-like hydrolase/transferase [Vibrio lentus]|nr:sulfatase-like hydrolase/transferase [Vibrio lentus]
MDSSAKYQGKSVVSSIYAGGVQEHDDQVGILLDKLDEPKIADDTIVFYSTDNGGNSILTQWWCSTSGEKNTQLRRRYARSFG